MPVDDAISVAAVLFVSTDALSRDVAPVPYVCAAALVPAAYRYTLPPRIGFWPPCTLPRTAGPGVDGPVSFATGAPPKPPGAPPVSASERLAAVRIKLFCRIVLKAAW